MARVSVAGEATTRRFVLLLAGVCLSACFPAMQTPEVVPGFHIDESAMVIGDHGRPSAGPVDIMAWVGPAYGKGDVEVGIPVGEYYAGSDNGVSSQRLIVIPYFKTQFLGKNGPDKLSAVVQFGAPVVSSIGVLYGRDLGTWTPYGGLKWMASGGPVGDDVFITRYQVGGQLLMVFTAGAEWHTSGHPTVETGMLMNHTPAQTLFDLYLGFRLALGAQ